MTDAEWQACTDPDAMLEFLEKKVSSRKLRLFAVACCRRIWSLLIDERSRSAVEAAEQFAEGLVGSRARANARTAALAAVQTGWQAPPVNDPTAWELWRAETYVVVNAASAAQWAAARKASHSAYTSAKKARNARAAASNSAREIRSGNATEPWIRAEEDEKLRQADLLRDVFGNPFRRIVIEPAWLGWRDGSLQKLARTIDSERSFDRLPILAEMLREAGCGEGGLLSHCLADVEHIRGCWVIDLLLGKPTGEESKNSEDRGHVQSDGSGRSPLAAG
jgi:hypothetical protein